MSEADTLIEPKPIQSPPRELDDSALSARLCLALVPGVGPKLFRALLARFGSAAAVLDATSLQLRGVPGIGTKLSLAIARAKDEIDVAGELALCRQHQIDILHDGRAEYPAQLKEIHDPPALLYTRGKMTTADSLAVAIVGSRHATPYGTEVAEKLAAGLARRGITVISGLARGIDSAAHRGALNAGGRTIAVLGCGLLNIYPPENASLAIDISRQGAVLTESPLRAKPLPGMFPQRNRIISGLSLGVVVVEASKQSGALITARHAMEQGREVFAVPGRIDSHHSGGCHDLLRDGARIVASIDDILDELGPLTAPVPTTAGTIIEHPAELNLNDAERSILAELTHSAITIDEVVRGTQLPTHQVLATLSALEMRRLVRRLGGNSVARA